MVLFPTITLATDTISNAGYNTVTVTLSNNAKSGLVVSPNPASDRFSIVLPQAGAATVALRDLTGRVVLAPAVLAADNKLCLPARLATGVYLLEVRQGAVNAVCRMQKNKDLSVSSGFASPRLWYHFKHSDRINRLVRSDQLS